MSEVWRKRLWFSRVLCHANTHDSMTTIDSMEVFGHESDKSFNKEVSYVMDGVLSLIEG